MSRNHVLSLLLVASCGGLDTSTPLPLVDTEQWQRACEALLSDELPRTYQCPDMPDPIVVEPPSVAACVAYQDIAYPVDCEATVEDWLVCSRASVDPGPCGEAAAPVPACERLDACW